MAKIKHRALQMVEQAIKETGSEELLTISDWLEKYMRNRMANRNETRESRVWSELAKLGIATTVDIKRLVSELNTVDEPEPEEKPIKKAVVVNRRKGELYALLCSGQAGTWGEMCSAGKYVPRH